jgi:hypothetical protein
MDKQVELFKSFMKASKGMKRLHEEEQQLQKESQRNGQRVPLAKKKRHQVLQGKYLDALFDVTQEGEQLKEIKDVMDELQIITHINECQEEVIYKLRDILTPQETGKKSNNRRGTSLTRGDQEEEGFQDDSYENAFEKSTAHQTQPRKQRLIRVSQLQRIINKEDFNLGHVTWQRSRKWSFSPKHAKRSSTVYIKAQSVRTTR